MYLNLGESVLYQLENGASSGVSGLGLEPINIKNVFEDEAIDPPRILDALVRAIKDGYIAGPFKKEEVDATRINSFLSVPKPNGDRRQCGDLSSPRLKSFNENADPDLVKCWKMTQLTAKQFSFMLMRMGKKALMGKSDLKQECTRDTGAKKVTIL